MSIFSYIRLIGGSILNLMLRNDEEGLQFLSQTSTSE